MAGLLLGLRLAGVKSDVVGVRVTPASIANADVVKDLVTDCAGLLRSHGAEVPDVGFESSDVLMDDEHFGAGYGHATEASKAAEELMMGTEGIQLDVAYTSKAFASLLDDVRENPAAGPVLFWNTFNSVDLSETVVEADFRDLPEEFQRFYTECA
jgi:D-cysteine desulfhydrase